MAGHRPFSGLMKDWSPERRARNEAHKAKLEAELMGRAATRDAIEELEAGKGVRFTSVEALMSDLHEHDCSTRNGGGVFRAAQIGRATGRERSSPYVYISL